MKTATFPIAGARPDGVADPARRAMLGGLVAGAALAGLPRKAPAAPLPPFASRAWLPVPERASADYDFGLVEGSSLHPWSTLVMGPLAGDTRGQAAASFTLGDPRHSGMGGPAQVRRGPYRRADGVWHDVPGGANWEAGSEIRFTPAGDAIAFAVYVDYNSHMRQPVGLIDDLHREGTAWIERDGGGGGNSFVHSMLVRRSGEVLIAAAVTPMFDSFWSIGLWRRSAPGRVWSVTSPFVGEGEVVDIALLECPAGDLLMFWRDSAGRCHWSRQVLPGGVWGPENIFRPGIAIGASPQLRLDPAGNLFVAWMDGAAATPGLRIARMGATAGNFDAPVVLPARAGSRLLAFDMLADGRPALAWIEPATAALPMRAGLAFGRAGGGFDLPAPYVLPATATQALIGLDADGDAVLAWSDDNLGLAFNSPLYASQPVVASQVQAVTRPRATGVWGGVRRIDGNGTAPVRCGALRLAVAADGAATVAWLRSERVGDAGIADPADRIWIRGRLEAQRLV